MTNETMSPLRRRMIEDMTIRNFGPKTHHDYIRSVRSLAVFLGRSPDTVSNEDVRRFQLRLSSDGISAANMNNTVSGLRFFFRVTLGRAVSRAICRSSASPTSFPSF
jgi:integrase/recombinase XerD